jgi:hypothetical protein
MPSSVVVAMYYKQKPAILRIVFTSGNVYDYKNVPAFVYRRMKGAVSKGKFLNRHIKGHYKYREVN